MRDELREAFNLLNAFLQPSSLRHHPFVEEGDHIAESRIGRAAFDIDLNLLARDEHKLIFKISRAA
jgi:hypothetical protein